MLTKCNNLITCLHFLNDSQNTAFSGTKIFSLFFSRAQIAQKVNIKIYAQDKAVFFDFFVVVGCYSLTTEH